jgi:O-antigen/teichoic acid export membrane protein
LPGALGSAIARAIPVIGLGMLFGPIAAGSYEMASRVLGRPSALVGNQFYTVFYPKSVAQLAQGKSIAGMVELWMPRLLLLFAPPFLLVAFFGRPLFAFVFGSQWSDAGLYAAILAPAWYVGGVATPIRVFNSLGEQRLALVWQGVVVVGTATAMAFGPVLGGDITTVALVSTVWTLAYLVHLGITIRLSGADPRRIWTGLFAPLRRSSGAQLADRLAGAPTTIDSPAPTPSLRQSA